MCGDGGGWKVHAVEGGDLRRPCLLSSSSRKSNNWSEVISRQTKAIGVAAAYLFLEVVRDAHSYHVSVTFPIKLLAEIKFPSRFDK